MKLKCNSLFFLQGRGNYNDSVVINKENIDFFKSLFNLNDNKLSKLKIMASTSLIVSTVALIAFSQLLKKRSQMMICVSSIFVISMLCLYFSKNIRSMMKLKGDNIMIFHASIQSFVESKITNKKFIAPLAVAILISGLILLLPIVSSIINIGISLMLIITYSYLFYEYVLKSETKSNNLNVLDYITAALAFSVPISLVTSIFTTGYMASVLSFSSTMAISLFGLYFTKFDKDMNKLGDISSKIYKLCREDKRILSAALVVVLLVGLFIINVLKPLFLVMFGIAIMFAFFCYFVNLEAQTRIKQTVIDVINFRQ